MRSHLLCSIRTDNENMNQKGKKDEAVSALQKSIELGYDDSDELLNNKMLKPLHDNDKYKDLIRNY